MNKKCVAALGLLGMGVVAVAQAAPAPAPAGDAAAGQIKSAMCASCHGPNGNSAVGTFPKLAGQQAAYIRKQLRDFQSGKRKNAIMNGMAAGLSPQDISNLAAYFSQQKTVPGTAQGDKKMIQLGQTLYRGGDFAEKVPACMSCHGPSGAGVPPHFPRVGSQWAQYVQEQLLAFRDGSRTNDPSGMMQAISKRLTKDQIAAVSQYIAGLHSRTVTP
ncbi:MAG TPA: c-type cytochrome [Acidiferrobacteraceae bacterium]|nr:c-type cytochrome [Acidiferrobacteraceae bacterium]